MHACVKTVLVCPARGLTPPPSPPRQTVLCAYGLPLRDKGQVSHPTETARKGEDDSRVQTDPKESERNTASWLRSPSRGLGSPGANPREGQSQSDGG